MTIDESAKANVCVFDEAANGGAASSKVTHVLLICQRTLSCSLQHVCLIGRSDYRDHETVSRENKQKRESCSDLGTSQRVKTCCC